MFLKPLTAEQKVIEEALRAHRRSEAAQKLLLKKRLKETAMKMIVPSVENDGQVFVAQEIGDQIVSINVEKSNPMKVKQAKKRRPDNWMDIALEYSVVNKLRRCQHVIKKYNLPVDPSQSIGYWPHTLNVWVKDLNASKKLTYVRGSTIPKDVEEGLVAEVARYNRQGIPLGNVVLRMKLLQLMEAKGLRDEVAKPNSFGDSWFQRFYKRHKFSNRIATTKMREEIPAMFEAKKSMYISHLSAAIHGNNIPDELIIGIDETNSQFVPSIKRTRAPTGCKRIRIVGIGKEKAQITTTFGATAAGDMLPKTQLIFGGKTVRCHPDSGRGSPPDGLFYAHTPTHWQSPETFLSYIETAIVPYHRDTVKKLNLPPDQKCILILDLHFSHKGDAVRDFCKAKDIELVYIPAGCTDIFQVCDVLLNKPYKNALCKAFIEYVTGKFADHLEKKTDQLFSLNMAVSTMKPLLPGFVSKGVAALCTPAMKTAIRKCFLINGMVSTARTTEALAIATELLKANNEPPQGEEVEIDAGPVEEDTTGDEEQPFILDFSEGGAVIDDERLPTDDTSDIDNEKLQTDDTSDIDNEKLQSDDTSDIDNEQLQTDDTPIDNEQLQTDDTPIDNEQLQTDDTPIDNEQLQTDDTPIVNKQLQSTPSMAQTIEFTGNNNVLTFNVNVCTGNNREKRRRVPNSMHGAVKKSKYSV